ncbi:MAG: NifB/NifX family molybdenum-iron cluster-binding protein [bacterium]
MLICIPTIGDSGLADTVCAHFGSAPFFTVLNTETDSVEIMPNNNAQHQHGACQPLAALGRFNLDCIVCGGMGRRAIEALNSSGITVYRAVTASVTETVAMIEAGKLPELDPAQACQGHGHNHGGGGNGGHGCGDGGQAEKPDNG